MLPVVPQDHRWHPLSSCVFCDYRPLPSLLAIISKPQTPASCAQRTLSGHIIYASLHARQPAAGIGTAATCLGFRCWMTVDFPLLSSPTHRTLHCGLANPIASSIRCKIPILRCAHAHTHHAHTHTYTQQTNAL